VSAELGSRSTQANNHHFSPQGVAGTFFKERITAREFNVGGYHDPLKNPQDNNLVTADSTGPG
jgi:hypothetical protein